MSLKEFREEKAKGFLKPAYLLVSPDRFLLSEALASFRAAVPQDQREFLLHSYDLISPESEKVPVEQIIDAANTVPFFGSRQFVVIDNVQKLLKKDLASLARYLARPAEHSVLVLVCHGSPKKETKEALSAARSIVLEVREKDIPRWLVEKARSAGLALTDAAAQYLLGLIGPDLGMLSSELEKLALLGQGKITKDAINDIVEGKRTYNAFALTDALSAGDADAAFRIYRHLRETEDSYSVLGAINWHFARRAEAGRGRGGSAAALRTFGILHEADVGIKTSSGSYPLELALARLSRHSGSSRPGKK